MDIQLFLDFSLLGQRGEKKKKNETTMTSQPQCQRQFLVSVPKINGGPKRQLVIETEGKNVVTTIIKFLVWYRNSVQ